MVFVEVFRFLVVLAAAVGGLEVGHAVAGDGHGPIIGMLLAAGIFYVLGGLVGRLLDRGFQRTVFQLRNMPPGEIFAGSLLGTSGLLLALAVGLALLAFVRSDFEVLATAVVAWLLASLGWRIGVAKGRQVIQAAGLNRILAPTHEPPSDFALLVDTSAVMERTLFVYGRAGLLPGGLVVPRFVLDSVTAISDGPDPATSRRAHRGLESLEALRALGVPVHVDPEEVPEADTEATKMLTLARRLGLRIGTCTGAIAHQAADWDVEVTDLRKLAADLNPSHPSGERLVIDLVKEGNQPRQAVGYLPEGDMVVVNDALHLVGSKDVEVTVLSTRPTSQGLLVFARLADAQNDMALT